MKTIDEYMALPYRMEIVEDMDEGGFVISCPELPGCISSGESMEAALKNIQAAKWEWLNVALKENLAIYEPNPTAHYSGQFKLRLPKSLHRRLSENAKKEGVSMNQYCLFLLSRNDSLRYPD